MDPRADRVRLERLRRGWSVRTAATRGDISNTWWGKFEDHRQPLTPAIAAAVAKAYEWPNDWANEDTIAIGYEVVADRLTAIEAKVGESAFQSIIPGDVLLERFLILEAKVDNWATHAHDRGADILGTRDDVAEVLRAANTITALVEELTSQAEATLELLHEIRRAVG